MASKRRSFISLIFIINCMTKCSLISIYLFVKAHRVVKVEALLNILDDIFSVLSQITYRPFYEKFVKS